MNKQYQDSWNKVQITPGFIYIKSAKNIFLKTSHSKTQKHNPTNTGNFFYDSMGWAEFKSSKLGRCLSGKATLFSGIFLIA